MDKVKHICESLSNNLNVKVTSTPDIVELNRGEWIYIEGKKTRIFVDDYVLKTYENNMDELILTIQEYIENNKING